MAYSTLSPPSMVLQSISGARRWHYSSADPIATVNTAGYISNGDALGMKVGDIVDVRDTATPGNSICYVVTVTAGGSADLTDGLAITATNTD